MRNLKELVETLDSVCKYLDSKYEINNGGCCYVAYIIASFLDKYNISYSLEIESDSEVNEFNYQDETFYHYYLKVNKFGYVNKLEFEEEYHFSLDNVNSENIKQLYDNGFWNDDYDISNNRKVKRKIYSIFKKYERRSV